jgi:hypothetical protein
MAHETRFSRWYKWSDRSEIPNLRMPGVYVLAVSSAPIEGKAFSWLPEIIYVGMTNSVHGLTARLRQFEETIRGTRCNHGGADRVRYKYRSFSALSKKLFVAIAPVRCDVTTNAPDDLRAMGSVAKLEYDCLAEFVERQRQLPEFNDKKRSKKYSLTDGRKGLAS